MTYAPLLLPALSVGLVLAGAAILHLTQRLRVATRGRPPLDPADVAAIGQALADALGATPETRLETLAAKIDQMRAEVDWMLGESLIHQAVNMASHGHPEAEISEMTGISAEEIRAIRRFRRH